MTDSVAHDLNWQKKTARRLLLVYGLFVVYGCFIPFRFNLDPNFVKWRWEVFLIEPMRGNLPRLAVPDAVSNVLLFVPFGIFCVWVMMANRARHDAFLPILLTAAYGLAFGVALESGQTLSPWRSPSLIDVASNAIGALIGASFGRILFHNVAGLARTRPVQALQEHPSLLALAYLLAGVFIDAFYPFAVTLDVSTVWQNFKQSQWLPSQGIFHSHGLNLIVEKGAIFAAIGYLVAMNAGRRFAASAPGAWLACSFFALAIETGKLFFAGRSFAGENVALSSLGALLGVLLERTVPNSAWLRSRRQAIWFLLVFGFAAHFELTPFDWISPSELPARLSQVEWLPFKSYYAAEPLWALFDLQRKIYFFLPLGFTAMALYARHRAGPSRGRALLACLGIAAALESLQLLVRSRVPSVTDLMTFSASAWGGIVLFELLQGMKIGMLQASCRRPRGHVNGQLRARAIL